MTWLGHENGCQIQSGAPCDCRLPGEAPCICSPFSGLHPECPLHGEVKVKPTYASTRPAPVMDEPVDLSVPEERPADDPWIPVCDGRDCGGRPHE